MQSRLKHIYTRNADPCTWYENDGGVCVCVLGVKFSHFKVASYTVSSTKGRLDKRWNFSTRRAKLCESLCYGGSRTTSRVQAVILNMRPAFDL